MVNYTLNPCPSGPATHNTSLMQVLLLVCYVQSVHPYCVAGRQTSELHIFLKCKLISVMDLSWLEHVNKLVIKNLRGKMVSPGKLYKLSKFEFL